MFKLFRDEILHDLTTFKSVKNKYAITNYGRVIRYDDHHPDGAILEGYSTNGFRTFSVSYKSGGKTKRKVYSIYKLVAEFFIPKKSEEQTHVLHLDFNPCNDFHKNLRWATYEEKVVHHRKNPKVIEGRKRTVAHVIKSDGHKLTANKVRYIKKRLADPNRTTRLKMLAKQFNISEMQLYRIKRGENWGHITI